MNIEYDEVLIVKEGLFEKCLYNHIVERDGENIDYSDWFKYMITMREIIDNHKTLKDDTFLRMPSQTLYEMGYSKSTVSSIQDCVENSFETPGVYSS